VDLANRLNRFSHSMDVPRTDVDVAKLVEEVVGLQERFARLKHVKLSALPSEGNPVVRTNPLRFQMVLCALIEHGMNGLHKGGEIGLRVGGAGVTGSIDLVVSVPEGQMSEEMRPAGPVPEGLAALQGILPGVRMEITPGQGPGQTGLLIQLTGE
jgi:signal transduction histidine kinase